MSGRWKIENMHTVAPTMECIHFQSLLPSHLRIYMFFYWGLMFQIWNNRNIWEDIFLFKFKFVWSQKHVFIFVLVVYFNIWVSFDEIVYQYIP